MVGRWRSEEKVSPGKPLARVALAVGKDHHARVAAIREAVTAAGRIADLEIEEAADLGPEEVRLLAVERAD